MSANLVKTELDTIAVVDVFSFIRFCQQTVKTVNMEQQETQHRQQNWSADAIMSQVPVQKRSSAVAETECDASCHWIFR